MRKGACCLAGTALAMGAWACGEPTKPAPAVANVVVTSPIGSRLAVGRTVQLTATARDAGGAAMPGVAIAWSSTAPTVAEVSSAGLVTGHAEGSATITATAQGVAGSFNHQVLAADIAGATSLLSDAFASALLGGLTSALKTQVQTTVAQCRVGMDAGNFDTMEGAVDATRAAITAATDPTDKALAASFALFVDHVNRLLKL